MYKCFIYSQDYELGKNLKLLISKLDFEIVFLSNNKLDFKNHFNKEQMALLILDTSVKNFIELLKISSHLNYSIILISSVNSLEIIRAAIKYDVLDYFSKPVDYLTLQHTIESLHSTFKNKNLLSMNLIFTPLIKDNYNNYYVNIIVKYIVSNYTQKVQIKNLTNITGISDAYIMRLFKSYVGISIIDYVNRYRIYKSISLFNKGFKYYEIAEKVGFKDYKTYVYHFKKYLNISPKNYIN